MKKLLILLIAFLLVFTLNIHSRAQSNEEISSMTAKSYSMGGAFTGIADDVSAVLFNPAGLTQSGIVGLQTNIGVSNIEIEKITEVTDFMNEVSKDINFSDLDSLKKSFPEDITVNVHTFAGANLKSVALSGNLKSSYDIYKNNNKKILENNNDISAIISYGAKLASPPAEIASLAYGFNIKMTQHKYNKYSLQDNQLTEIKADGNSIDLDFGLLAKLTDIFKVGAQVENIYSSGYDLEGNQKVSTYSTDSEEWIKESSKSFSDKNKDVNRDLRIGASVEVPVIGTTLAADLENVTSLSESNNTIYHLGVQQNLILNLISLRAGTYGPEINGKNSIYTAGAGINLTKLHLDIGIGTDKSGDNMSGMISGRFKF